MRKRRERFRARQPYLRRIVFECLESRRVLASDPILTEIVASNQSSLSDGNLPPSTPDWLEIYNAGDDVAVLDGWFLTDDANDLDKWSFPDGTHVEAGEFLVVFASGQDRPDLAGNLHTSFRLAAAGEYVGLIRPDGSIASAFGADGSNYPRLVTDVSFGRVMQPSVQPLVSPTDLARFLVPSSAVDVGWTGSDPNFDDGDGTDWMPLTMPVGFGADVKLMEALGTDVESAMRTRNSSGLVRIPFEIADQLSADAMALQVAFDDGFEAYINGHIVAAANSPKSVSFDASATGTHDGLGNAFVPDPNQVSIWYDFEGDGGQVVTDKLTADGAQNLVFNSGGNVDAEPTNAAFGSRSLRLPQSPPVASFFNRVRLPETASLGDQFTLAMQLNTDNTSVQRLFSNYNGTGELASERLLFDIDVSGASFPGLRLGIGGRGEVQTDAVPAALRDPGYHHIALTYDHGEVQIFVDGETVLGSSLGSGGLNMPLDLHIGEDPHDVGGLGNEQLIANIDDVVVLANVALTPTGIRLMSNEGAAALFGQGGTEPLFENFDISSQLDKLQTGENVLAIHGMNVGADDDDFFLTAQLNVVENPDALPPAFFPTPTPGAINESPVDGIVGDTRFSVDRGFFSEPFNVEVSVPTKGATIIYTTDGSAPGLTNGTQVQAANGETTPLATIPITTTTILRATGFKHGYHSSNVDTQTYLFLEDVIRQPSSPPELPTFWGPTRADYEMDPNVVNVAPYHESILDALTSIPTVSLSLDPEHFFGAAGIYSNTLSRGREWERPVSVEYFDAFDSGQFQVNAGLRVHGGFSRDPSASPQHSLRLHFRSEYGPGRLEFPLFKDSDVSRFDALVLNAQSSDNWSSVNLTTGRVAQFLRDQWAQDMQREMGHAHIPGKYTHVYINGLYWGLYGLMERLDDAFTAEHFGGAESQYDVIVDEVAFRGDLTVWRELLGHVRSDNYDRVQELLDVDNFIDYMIVNMHMGNWDWPDHNWHAYRRQSDGEKFRFLVWDAEVGLGLDVNVPGPIRAQTLDVDLTGSRRDVSNAIVRNGPGEIYNRLRTNPEFQLRFADRLQKHFFHDGALTPENAKSVYGKRADEIEQALIAQSARWGDVRREPPDVPDGVWLSEKNWILDSYFPARTNIVLDDFRNVQLYPDVMPVDLAQQGGAIDRGFELTMSHSNGSGRILYTVDGSDPRLPGGAISSTADEYDVPLSLVDNVTLKSRVLVDGAWSALNEATFSLSRQPIEISELNYHPHAPTAAERTQIPGVTANAFEFVELYHAGTTPIDVSGFSFVDGIRVTLDQVVLDPNEYAVIVSDAVAFRARYGDEPRILGEFDGQLSDGGETVRLVDAIGRTITSIDFDDSGFWPRRADGSGATLQRNEQSLDRASLSTYVAWRGSVEYGGTPGSSGRLPLGVVVNEVLANAGDDMDAIELRNSTDEAINIGGWFLSDSDTETRKFTIPAGTVLHAGETIVFDENDFNPTPNAPKPTDFSLSGQRGDDVWLTAPTVDGSSLLFADDVHFRASETGQTIGRSGSHGEFVNLSRNTIGCENSTARVGDVQIIEIQYLPSAPSSTASSIADLDGNDLEYLVVTIPNGVRSLSGWRIRGGIEYDFDEEPVDSDVLWILSFDPDSPHNSDKLRAFKNHYQIEDDSQMQFVGGYSGSLRDAGDYLRLERPRKGLPEGPNESPTITVEEFAYSNGSSWPSVQPGESIIRRSTTFPAAEGKSWRNSMHDANVLEGDLDGDSQLSPNDIDYLFDAIFRGSQNAGFRLSGMPELVIDEVSFYVAEILHTVEGDANLDGVIDALDLNELGKHWTQGCASWSRGDFNGDRFVNANDLNVVGRNWPR